MSATITNSSLRDLSRLGTVVAATFVVAVVLWLSVGAAGVLIAGVVSFVWAVTRPAYAVAVGGVLYVVPLSGGGPLTVLVAASLGAVFLADVLVRWPARTAAVASLAFVPTLAALSEVSRFDSISLAAITAFAAFAVVVYAIHRYGLVRLHLVEGAEP